MAMIIVALINFASVVGSRIINMGARVEANVRVSGVEGKGRGVFAVDAIEADAWVCSYEGVLATDDECDARYNWDGSPSGDYCFRLEDKSEENPRGLVLDAANSSHFSRFFNHAEHANIEARISASDRRIGMRRGGLQLDFSDRTDRTTWDQHMGSTIADMFFTAGFESRHTRRLCDFATHRSGRRALL